MNRNKTYKLIEVGIIFLIFIIGCMIFLSRPIDSDVYHYLTFGEEIVTTGIPYMNHHHIYENLAVVVQEWLYDYILCNIYSTFSWIGLSIFEVIVFAALFSFIYLVFNKHIENTVYKIAALIITMVPIALLFSIRVQFISLLLLLIQVYFINTKYNKFIFPIILLLEINLHSSFWIFHILVILPYLVPFFRNTKVNRLKLGITTLASLPIMFLNPYGIDAILYLYYSLTSNIGSPSIQELMPWELSSWGAIYILLCLAMFITVFKKLTNAEIYMFAGMFILSLIYKRNLLFLVIPVFLICLNKDVQCFVTEKIKNSKITEFVKQYITPSKVKVVCCSVLIGGLLLAAITYYSYSSTLKIIDVRSEDNKEIYPNIVNILNEREIEEVFTTFNTGSYLEWKGFKCYFDSIPEIYSDKITKSKDVLTEYANLSFNHYSLLDNFQYVVTDNPQIHHEFTYRREWVPVSQDSNTILYWNTSYIGN